MGSVPTREENEPVSQANMVSWTYLVLPLSLNRRTRGEEDERATPKHTPLSPMTSLLGHAANAHYVAVMATMPPAAPARAWITESLMTFV